MLTPRMASPPRSPSLTGDGGLDFLDEGQGADTMAGSTGNDVYYVDSTGDVVIETSTIASEADTIIATASVTLSANVERVSLRGSDAIDATGNGLNNLMNGNELDNKLSGLAGNDRLFGFGDDDSLDGGAGSDILTGGDGDDVFVFTDPTFSPNGVGRDRIADFEQGIDMIDVSAITTARSDGAYVLLDTSDARFSGAGGELRLVTIGNLYVVQGDTDGDKRADTREHRQRIAASVDFPGAPLYPLAEGGG